ncbi:MAG: EI24 domain-containing protein, partial [Geminicoccaceae bacterium]
MLKALILGFETLGDPVVRRLLVRCVLLALTTFVALLAAVALILGNVDLTGWPWLDTIVAFAGSAVVVVLAWLLFPVAVAAGLNFFAEDVAEAVERRHYPELGPALGLGIAQSIWASVRFAAFALLLNLLVLPVYLLPVANAGVYLALNGYLLGREYFEVVALRRVGPAAAKALRREARLTVWLAGVVIAVMLIIPFFNLVAPVVGVGFMVHLFQRLLRRSRYALGAGRTPIAARGRPSRA